MTEGWQPNAVATPEAQRFLALLLDVAFDLGAGARAGRKLVAVDDRADAALRVVGADAPVCVALCDAVAPTPVARSGRRCGCDHANSCTASNNFHHLRNHRGFSLSRQSPLTTYRR